MKKYKYIATLGLILFIAMRLLAQSPFTDNFTRANEDPLNSTNYALSAFGTNQDLAVVSNTCEVGSTTGFNPGWAFYNGSSPNDQYMTVTLSSAMGGYVLGIVRAPDNSTNTGYILFVNLTFLSYTVQPGSGSAIISGSYSALNPGDTIGVQAAGTQICATRNGSAVACATDSTYSSGSVALGIQISSARNDTTLAGFATGTASPLTPPSSGSTPRQHKPGTY